jgi:hypothetical protein
VPEPLPDYYETCLAQDAAAQATCLVDALTNLGDSPECACYFCSE